jgi:hypothetical protein
MKPRAQLILAGLLLAASCLGAAGGDRPPVGSYGFDSLKPETTRCAKLDAAQIGKLTACTFSKRNSFGDDREGWVCHVGKRIGFMAYRTRADCQAELELERANGD